MDRTLEATDHGAKMFESIPDATLPDAGKGMCCMGAAARGPGFCTCWRPVYDREQAPPQEGPPRVRDRMCRDCAFRKDSPERQGDKRYDNSGEDGIDDLVRGERSFVCHQGMRKKIALVHEPTGARVDIEIDAYAPGGNERHTCKADGTPADICAGWWAAKQRSRRDAG